MGRQGIGVGVPGEKGYGAKGEGLGEHSVLSK